MRLPALSSFLSSERSWPSLILVNEFGPANTHKAELKKSKKEKPCAGSRLLPGPKKRGDLMSLPALARPSQTTCLNCPSRSQPGPEARINIEVCQSHGRSVPVPWPRVRTWLPGPGPETLRARAAVTCGHAGLPGRRPGPGGHPDRLRPSPCLGQAFIPYHSWPLDCLQVRLRRLRGPRAVTRTGPRQFAGRPLHKSFMMAYEAFIEASA